MKRITVGKNDQNQRLDKFLSKLLKDAPSSMIYKWIRKKRVKVNGKKQDISYILKEDDVLELYINDEFFSQGPKTVKESPLPRIIYEDSNILVLDKPSGSAAHGEDGSLIERVLYYLYKKGEYTPENENSFTPALCNRIDKNTSGLVIAAKNAMALREINKKIHDREIDKFYIAKLEKAITPPNGTIEGYLLKNEKERKVYFCKTQIPGSKFCKSQYKTIKDNLVEIKLITGRTHQIRSAFSFMGYPLKGDVKYGAAKTKNKDFQMLRSYKIVFDFKTPAGEMDYLKEKVIEANLEF